MDSRTLFISTTTAKLISILGLLLMPFQIGVLVSSLELSKSAAGFIGSMETTGFALGVAIVALRLLPLNIREFARYGLLFVLAGNLLCMMMDSVSSIVFTRFLAGVSYGFVNAAASRILAGCFEIPEKASGHVYAVIYIVATILYFIYPSLVELGGARIFYGSISLLVMLAGPFMWWWLPKETFKTDNTETHNTSKQPSRISVFLAVPVLIFFVGEIIMMGGLGGVWSFSERLADAIDIDPGRVGFYFALSSITSIIGSIAAGQINVRLGRMLPILAPLVPLAVFCLMLSYPIGEMSFVVGLLGYQLIFAFLIPYLIGVGAAMNKHGHIAAAVVGVEVFAFGSGSFIGGVAADAFGLPAVGWLGVFGCIGAAIIFPFVIRPLDRKQSEARQSTLLE